MFGFLFWDSEQKDEMSCSGVDPQSRNKSDSVTLGRGSTPASLSAASDDDVYLSVCGFGLDGSQKCNPASNLVRTTD